MTQCRCCSFQVIHSTLNVADEGVCDIPVNEVNRWIDSNDFKQNEDAKVFKIHVYFTDVCLHKNNNKHLSLGLTQMEKQLRVNL